MDFGTGGREGYCEDEQMIHNKSGKFLFSSSSASASSSSPQYKGFFPLSNGRTGTEVPIYSWLGTKEEISSRSYEEDAGESGQLALSNSGVQVQLQKEHMFDKVVTPSDVGKLNRLVIPKQHAEKYFPLDSTANEKGLLLNFEDRVGKPWRFRYSYWNSSQSYVMTKGWSRFVKEKKLDAGDIVSFQRGVGESGKDRLYIDWRRRRPNAAADAASFPNTLSFPYNSAFNNRSIPWSNPLFMPPPPPTMSSTVHFPHQQNNYISFHPCQGRNSYNNKAANPCQGSIIYLRSAAAATPTPQDQDGGGGGIEPMAFDSVPVVHGKAAGKKLRLFGVNMECTESDESNAASMASQPSSSPTTIPFTLQSRLYNGIPLQFDFLNKGKSSSMSLDLDI